MNETTSDTRSEIDDATIRSAYATYLSAFADPSMVERWTKPLYSCIYKMDPPSGTSEDLAKALVEMLGGQSIVLPPEPVIEIQAPSPAQVAAVRLSGDPHTDDDAPMSFNAFAARLRAVLAT